MGDTPQRTSSDWRAQADLHDRKAASLVSGENKDSHIIAAKACRNAADCIDKAHRSSLKTQIFEAAVSNGDSAGQLVQQLKAQGFNESEIKKLTEGNPDMDAAKFWQD